jgi:hypothetical protein
MSLDLSTRPQEAVPVTVRLAPVRRPAGRVLTSYVPVLSHVPLRNLGDGALSLRPRDPSTPPAAPAAPVSAFNSLI